MSSNGSDSDTGRLSRPRKKVPMPATWAQNVAKRLRNEGKEYISRKTKQRVRGREIGAPCSDGCFERITMPVIEKVHKDFWALGSFDLQNAFLQKQVRPVAVKRRRKPIDPVKGARFRTGNLEYKITHANKDYSVCAAGFFSIFDITRMRVNTAMKKVSSTGTPVPDKRGKHTQARTVGDAEKEYVIKHIKRLPTVSSHYTRAKSRHRRYLESNLSIEKLYQMYLIWMAEENPDGEKVKSSYYRKVFNEEFNISFKPPMTDTCARCDELKARVKQAEEEEEEEEKQRVQRELEEHLALAQEGQRLMKDYARNQEENVRVIAVDLQQTLPIPRISTNVAYYKRKLWCYNLCIHNVKEKKSQFYVWDEVSGGRGSLEIVSCIQKWVEEEYEKAEFDSLVVFSDNCGGQNKNINVVCNFLREVHRGKCQNIEHLFLMPGHSFMACDRAFGNIEKSIRSFGDVYDLWGYINIIANAVHSGYTVTHMKREDFLNYDDLKTYVVQRKPRDTSVKFKDARRLAFNFRYREGYFVGLHYPEESVVHPVRLMPGRANYAPSKFNLGHVQLEQKYATPLQLSAEKMKDLESLTTFMTSSQAAYLKEVLAEQENFFHGEEAPSPARSVEEEEEIDNDLLDYDF